jgi:hypothetical protein
MNILQRKPTKLKLTAFSDRELKQPSAPPLTVMYNPDSVSLDYQTDYTPDLFINTTRQSNRYVQTRPGDLRLELLLDAKMPGNNTSINRQITELRELCYNVNPADSQPRFLKVEWGGMKWGGENFFSGRMRSLSVRYTLFERDATPLRATATLVLTADGSLTLQQAKEQLKSPAAAVVNVPDATSLPQIANSAGTALAGGTDYLAVAAENDLDSLDAIKPGQTLQVSARKGGRS